jgi:saccharopepsin
VDPKYATVVGSNRISTWPIRNPYRWNVLVDAIIVDGSIVVPKSRVAGAPNNKAVSLMDSGTSYRCVLVSIETDARLTVVG